MRKHICPCMWRELPRGGGDILGVQVSWKLTSVHFLHRQRWWWTTTVFPVFGQTRNSPSWIITRWAVWFFDKQSRYKPVYIRREVRPPTCLSITNIQSKSLKFGCMHEWADANGYTFKKPDTVIQSAASINSVWDSESLLDGFATALGGHSNCNWGSWVL